MVVMVIQYTIRIRTPAPGYDPAPIRGAAADWTISHTILYRERETNKRKKEKETFNKSSPELLLY